MKVSVINVTKLPFVVRMIKNDCIVSYRSIGGGEDVGQE